MEALHPPFHVYHVTLGGKITGNHLSAGRAVRFLLFTKSILSLATDAPMRGPARPAKSEAPPDYTPGKNCWKLREANNRAVDLLVEAFVGSSDLTGGSLTLLDSICRYQSQLNCLGRSIWL